MFVRRVPDVVGAVPAIAQADQWFVPHTAFVQVWTSEAEKEYLAEMIDLSVCQRAPDEVRRAKGVGGRVLYMGLAATLHEQAIDPDFAERAIRDGAYELGITREEFLNRAVVVRFFHW